jgi:leucyl aminopeptidase
MSYDKCGAANVTGFFKVLAQLKPKQLKAVGVLAVARNSCGEEGFVADEILTTRAGVRIRVGNTDAEGKSTIEQSLTNICIQGRMVMADPLCYIKELALKEVNPHLFTMATLTGHVIRAYGTNYTVIDDNMQFE